MQVELGRASRRRDMSAHKAGAGFSELEDAGNCEVVGKALEIHPFQCRAVRGANAFELQEDLAIIEARLGAMDGTLVQCLCVRRGPDAPVYYGHFPAER